MFNVKENAFLCGGGTDKRHKTNIYITRRKKMLRKLNDANVEMLFKAMLSLENLEECYDFFEDICTLDEIQSIAKRLRAAKMLKDGLVYNEINEKTGLSTATISRVNRSMKYGNGGYDMVFGRIFEDKK